MTDLETAQSVSATPTSVVELDLQRRIVKREGEFPRAAAMRDPGAEDPLDTSLDHVESTALELMAFCRRIGLPFGINIESVSIRKDEIDASIRLAQLLRDKLAS